MDVLSNQKGMFFKQILSGVLVLVVAFGITACGKKEQKSGQVLAKVNGEEITVSQLNQELAHVNAPKSEATQKQVLDVLVSRQLVMHEAINSKLDREPNVMQAIERSKAAILTQAYMQNRASHISKPTKAEVDAFYQKHPELFSQRKVFDTKELVVATKGVSEDLTPVLDAAKSIDDVATWLDEHKVRYARRQISRSTTDLPSEMTAKWQAMKKGDKIIMREGEYAILAYLDNVSSAPISPELAAPQVEQYLRNVKMKEAQEAELARLRTAAKIEYLNPEMAAAPKPIEKAVDTKASNPMDQGIKGLR